MGDLDVIVEDRSGSEIGRWSKSGHVDTGWNQGFVFLPLNAEMVQFYALKYRNDNYITAFKSKFSENRMVYSNSNSKLIT